MVYIVRFCNIATFVDYKKRFKLSIQIERIELNILPQNVDQTEY